MQVKAPKKVKRGGKISYTVVARNKGPPTTPTTTSWAASSPRAST
ncbi:hypothetical protein [Nonomuraea salmonea]